MARREQHIKKQHLGEPPHPPLHMTRKNFLYNFFKSKKETTSADLGIEKSGDLTNQEQNVTGETIEKYNVNIFGAHAHVDIVKGKDFVSLYELSLPPVETETKLLDEVKEKLAADVSASEETDFKTFRALREQVKLYAEKLLEDSIPDISEKDKTQLAVYLLNEVLGLGSLEYLFSDNNVGEIVVNSSKEPVWVYHKNHGWLKTNIRIQDEEQIAKYASIIAKRTGKQIGDSGLLDANLISGDKANATLFPVSTKGNTLTIRKFARNPWTITDFISNKTITTEAAALVWQVVQYEGSLIVSGGTATGKTSFLQACLPFIQPNQRIISIEEARELLLPRLLHWIPMAARGNSEGKGEVSVHDLMVNALKMRPDKIVLGEIKKREHAEALFEAAHTGHSVYSTLHADTAEQAISKLLNPPISVPKNQLGAIDLLVVMYRDRRRDYRRVSDVAEIVPVLTEGSEALRPNVIYHWHPASDRMEEDKSPVKLFEKISFYTGLGEPELRDDLAGKKKILEWMVKNKITNLEKVGKVIAEYYRDAKSVADAACKNKKPEVILDKYGEK